jgi:pimeloyl-ACP methyl ester carboxylesterase
VHVVAGAGHVIQETHPEAVVTAVTDMLAKVRK